MQFTGQDKLMLFVENTQRIRKEFILQDIQTKRLAAILYAQAGKTMDCESIRQCHNLIKDRTGVFSTFRSNMSLCVAALLSLSPEPQSVFDETLKVYDMLKDAKLRASDFLAVAAYQIAARSDAFGYAHVVNRTRDFYDGMKERHFFYTGQDDYIFSAMLALSDLDVATGTARIEQLYSRLKGAFWSKNSVQALAQVLVLGNSDDDVVNRVLTLRDALRAQKIRLDKTYTLPVLGILALLPVEIDALVRDIDTARETLKAQKGFGALSVSSQVLLLYVSSLVSCGYADCVRDGVLTAALATSVTNIIIAQQAAMLAAVSASTTAAAAASSS